MRIFDPKLAISFHAVVTHGSLTAGAREIGVAQPWMSEQIRRLEEQLGFRVLIRSSRKLELTELGSEFLVHATEIAGANVKAQLFAARRRRDQDNTVRIGTSQFSDGKASRRMLIERLMVFYPGVEPLIQSGSSSELIARLIDGSLDVALVNQHGIAEDPRLEHLCIGPLYAHLLVPSGHPLADRDSVALDELADQELFVSSGKEDPASMQIALASLNAVHVKLVYCPDNDRSLIEAIAARHGGLCFRWLSEPTRRFREGNQTCVPLDGYPVINPMAAVRRRQGEVSKAGRAIWHVAGMIADESKS